MWRKQEQWSEAEETYSPEKLEPEASGRPTWEGRDNAARQGTGSWALYIIGMRVEAGGLVRAEQPGSRGARIWMRHTRMPGDLCHTHTHASHMLRAHSRKPVHTHTHTLFWGARAKALLRKGGLCKLPHGDPGQEIRCVQKRA